MARGKIVTAGSKVTYFINDTEVSKAAFDAAFPSKLAALLAAPDEMLAAHGSTTWPMKSEALACHPDQIPEIMERDRQHGVPTRRDRTGRPVLTSQAHRQALMKLEGVHDKNGCYGDTT